MICALCEERDVNLRKGHTIIACVDADHRDNREMLSASLRAALNISDQIYPCDLK